MNNTYWNRVLDFERRITPYITGYTDNIEYKGFLTRVYHFSSKRHVGVWQNSRSVLILGTYGPKSLVVATGWIKEKVKYDSTIERVKTWAKRQKCEEMFENPEWSVQGLTVRAARRTMKSTSKGSLNPSGTIQLHPR